MTVPAIRQRALTDKDFLDGLNREWFPLLQQLRDIVSYMVDDGGTRAVASGILMISAANHAVEVESGATDNLDTIMGGRTGIPLVLRAASTNVVTAKHGTGNLVLDGDADFALTGNSRLTLISTDLQTWYELGRTTLS